MYSGSVLTRNQMQQSRTQFYNANGSGRDSYIKLNNGGFCPMSQPTTIEELGKYALYQLFSRDVLLFEAETQGLSAHHSLQDH